MTDLRRNLLVFCIAVASCTSGPTSEWPHGGDPDEDGSSDEGKGPNIMDAGGAGRADAGVTSPPTQDCAGDAGGDASVDAGDAGSCQ